MARFTFQSIQSKVRVVAGIAALALVCVSHTVISAESHAVCDGFLPQNNMKIPVGHMNLLDNTPTGITEAQFNAVMDRMERLFSDDVKQAGGVFKINRNWDDPTVNAYAEQIGNSWEINMFGGLARDPHTTVEGMALVACHELGHHLGGAPKMSGWATDEGGADYFATLKCLRKYFAEDDNETITAAAKIEQVAKDRCAQQFTARADQVICMRGEMSGMSVAGLFMELSGDAVAPLYATPDTSKVEVTNDDHPATQCRMDTYYAGATCHVDKSIHNSDSDFKQGACVEGVDAIGFRPDCWFNPGSSTPAMNALKVITRAY